ncbi:unnamed protein product [Onchocerca flexuosa]|uniref:Nif11 domain-containing protein n=1 Tax=Onchocerca flexuosa TaxID=387005 RepID=A0A183HE66_9BILA|nr:unnamed protein product [Onchocerca flexuosa]
MNMIKYNLKILRKLLKFNTKNDEFACERVKENQARFSIEEAQEVLLWIEQVTDIRFDKDPLTFETAQDVVDALKDGTQLCM